MPDYLPMEEMEMFKRFVRVSDSVWKLATKWNPFARDTIGKQLVRAVDSIGANLVEGDGRFSSQDSIRFFRIARGSARETRYWLTRAIERDILSKDVGQPLIKELTSATKLLNLLIGYRRSHIKADRVSEARVTYAVETVDPFIDDEDDDLARELNARFEAIISNPHLNDITPEHLNT